MLFFTEFVISSRMYWPEFWEQSLFCSKRLLTRHHHHFERGSLSICGEYLENLQGKKSSSGKKELFFFSFIWSEGLCDPDSPADRALLWATQPGLWLHTPPADSAPKNSSTNKKKKKKLIVWNLHIFASHIYHYGAWILFNVAQSK